MWQKLVVVWCPGNRENGWNQLQAVTSRVSASPDILPASKPCSLRFHSSSIAAEPIWDVSESTITERGISLVQL